MKKKAVPGSPSCFFCLVSSQHDNSGFVYAKFLVGSRQRREIVQVLPNNAREVGTEEQVKVSFIVEIDG